MYEVFLNDRILNIIVPGKITLNKPAQIIDNLRTIGAVKKWFLEFVKSDLQEVLLLHVA